MLRNVLTLIATLCGAVIVTGIVGVWRRRGWGRLTDWWNAEGVPICILVWFAIVVLLLSRGCLRDV